MRSRRALLYTPGDDERKVRKAAGLGADCVCLDLEDGVAAGRKQAAREMVAQALQELDFGRSERLCRLNAPGSGLEREDLEAVLPARPDGVLVPKVGDAEQVRRLSARIETVERARGWPVGGIRLLVLIESARAVINLPEIAGVGSRLEALIFGAEDLAGDLGATRTPEAWEVFYARSAVVTAAAAYGLQALDMVNVDFRDLEGLRAEARQGAALGFVGKQVIHPDQVVPVQEAFTPSPQAIARAQRLVEAYQEHQAAGAGAFALDGKMVDRPMVRAAEGLLARARAAGAMQ